MTIKRMDHVSVVVDDLPAAIAFFTTLGMALEGERPVEGSWVDRLCGLEGVQVDITMMRTPDGHGRVELTKFRNPELVGAEPAIAPPNTLGLRQIMSRSKTSTTPWPACAPTAANSSARWPSTKTCTGSATCEALRASSSRWPRNSSDAFTAVRDTGDALGAPSSRYPVWQPSFFLAACAAVLLGALSQAGAGRVRVCRRHAP